MSYNESLSISTSLFFLLVMPLIIEEETDAKCEVIYKQMSVLSYLVQGNKAKWISSKNVLPPLPFFYFAVSYRGLQPL